MRTAPVRAYLFTAFSCAVLCFWPLYPDICPFAQFTPGFWFACVGMVALSVSRLYGYRHAVPAPELYVFAYALLLTLFINHLPFQVHTVDVRLISFEYNFGYCGMAIAKMYQRWTACGFILAVTYNSLMLAVTLTYLALPTIQVRRRFVGAVVLAGAIILPLYLICPGAGPKALLDAGFPSWIPDMSGPPASVVMPAMNPDPIGINAVPSGHFAWALLLFWFARRHGSKGFQITTGIYAALTGLATLGTGEHYVVDLITAVPYAAAIWALVHGQWRAAGTALVVVLAWLFALREGWALAIPPLAVWLLTGSCIAWSELRVANYELPAPVRAFAGSLGESSQTVPAGQAG